MLQTSSTKHKMDQPIVTISHGKLCGKTSTNINNETFYSFHGIPYAKPPLGRLRFKAPQPPEAWTGIRDATKEGHVCVQKHHILQTIIGSEDCLTLNVYTRDLPNRDGTSCAKPVMVWIHGGGFTSGSGNTEVYGPDFLMTQDVVLVTINYRTGILGFFCLEDASLNVPGNAGLKDMVMALKWVQKNIIYFSGDTDNVTIFGESAGAAASHYLILSPMARGLFHKAILQSGCALNVWARGRSYSNELANVLGLQTTNEKHLLNVIQDMPADELFKAAAQVSDRFIACQVRPHGPVIEKKSAGAFLTEEPIEIIKSGRYNHVPMIIGYTNREGMLSEIMQKPKPFQPITDFEVSVPHFLKLQPGSDISKLVAKEIKEFYYQNQEPTAANKDIFYVLETDNFFVREILKTVEYHTETSSVPIFLYRMSVETGLNMLKNVYSIEEPGVCHADDLGYLFKNLLTPEIEPKSDEDVAIQRFVQLWTNFAKFANPSLHQTENSIINVKWRPVSKNQLNFLDIGKELTMGVDPEQERMTFWQKILSVNPVHKL